MKNCIVLSCVILLCSCGGVSLEEQKFWSDRLKSSGLDSSKVEEFVSNENQAVVIDVMSNEFAKLPTSKVINRIRYLELEFTEKSMLTNIDGMRRYDDQLYILSGGEVLCFDINSGKFRFKVYNIGRGPNEIIRASDFDVDQNYVYVLDNAKVSMNLYSHAGKFVKCLELPYRATHFKVLDDGNFLLRMTPWNPHLPEIDGYSIVVADSVFRPLQKAFYHYGMTTFRSPYFANKNGRYFAPMFQQDILQYRNGKLHNKYHLFFGDMSPDKDMLNKYYGGETVGSDEYWGKYFTRSDCFAVGNYIIEQFWAGGIKSQRCLIIDTRDNRSLLFKSFDYDSPGIFAIDFADWNGWGSDEKSGEFFCQVSPFNISLFDSSKLIKLREALPDSLERMFLVSDDDLDKRNQIIAFFTLNDNLMSDILDK